MHESARAPFSALADAVWRCTSSRARATRRVCTRRAEPAPVVLSRRRCTTRNRLPLRRAAHSALGGTLSVARSLWLAEQHIATTAGSVRQVCAHRSCRGLTCPRAPQRVWSGATGESGSWPRAVRASLDRVSGVEGGGARRRWRLHRHEPRGGGRDTPSCEQPHTSHVALLVLTFDLACVTCKALTCVAGARDRASVRSEGVLYFCYYNKRVRDFTQDFCAVCVAHTCRDALESRACRLPPCRVCAPRHHTVVCAISAVIGWASFK